MSGTDDLTLAHEELTRLIDESVEEEDPVLVVSPSPHDRHAAHEVVGRAVRDVIERRGEGAPRWWMWGVWGDLPLPTIAVAFDERRRQEILTALEAYEGELRRNDYRRLVDGRSEMNASRGPELVFGFGSPGDAGPRVELLTEAVFSGGKWLLGAPQWLDPGSPIREPSGTEISAWLYLETVTQRYRSPGARPVGATPQNEEERARTWQYRLHEDALFSERQNFFLLAEAMLVVAAVEALTGNLSKPVLAIALSVLAIALTLAWMYVNRRQLYLVQHTHKRAIGVLPEFREAHETRHKPRISSTKLLTYGVPAVVLVIWAFILALSIDTA